MKRFYDSVVKYDKMVEDGKIEKVSEQFLVSAVSITDAEAVLYAELESSIKGQCDVTKILLSKVSEVIADIEDDGNKYFTVKISYLEKKDNGKIKKIPVYYLVYAQSTEAAYNAVETFQKEAIGDYEVNSIVETKIVDVFNYEEKKEYKLKDLREFLNNNNMTISVNKG